MTGGAAGVLWGKKLAIWGKGVFGSSLEMPGQTVAMMKRDEGGVGDSRSLLCVQGKVERCCPECRGRGRETETGEGQQDQLLWEGGKQDLGETTACE